MYSGLRKITRIALLVLLMALVCAASWAGSGPVVKLDASKLQTGPLAAWQNEGSLGGSFKSSGDVKVADVDGIKAVVFSGKEYLMGDFVAPASITGDKPWTCIVRAYANDTTGERTLFSWANRPGDCMEIEYGEAVGWGAIGTWSAYTSGWLDKTPATKKWHTLIYSYAGGKDGEFQAWSDSELIVKKPFTLNTKPGRPFVVGACMTDDPDKQYNFVHQINGAIASIELYDYGFTTAQSWKACGKTSAYPAEPARDASLDKLTTTLKWVPGTDNVPAYDLYVGTDAAEVEKATSKSKLGKAQDFNKVYKGKLTKTEFGPLNLDINKTYYWRVDQLDASGKVAQRGIVCKFSTESGNASNPTPSDSYIVVEGGKYRLGWMPGKYARTQNVYFGESEEAVRSGNKPLVTGLITSADSIPLPVENPTVGKTYYWRVESLNGKGISVAKGDVWSFRVVSKKLKVYISSGQSNSVGCSMVTPLPAKYKGFNKNVIIFVRGECRLGNGQYGWAYLRDGLGSGFGDRDGKGTFGPELLFGYEMAPTDPNQVIAIIKIAWGGTNLFAQWRPPSAGGQVGDLYTNWVKFYHEALDKLDPAFQPEICGMIWMQGESDSGEAKVANEYASNLANLIKDIRAETKCPNLPFVAAQISKFDAWKAFGDVIRAAEADLPNKVPFTATFPTDDYGQTDPWHYDTPGMVSLGQRFANAMKGLEKK